MATDVVAQKENYLPDYRFYHNNSAITKTVQSLVAKFPSLIEDFSQIFKSRKLNSQHVLRVTNHLQKVSNQNEKVKILLSFGEHAREFLSVESAIDLIERLVDSENHEIDLTKLDIYVIVNANPDGRLYVEETGNFCWRGTSTGVDINRNFDWEFGGPGSSGNISDEEYRGPHAFSGIFCNPNALNVHCTDNTIHNVNRRWLTQKK